jgi:hypothetical protein
MSLQLAEISNEGFCFAFYELDRVQLKNLFHRRAAENVRAFEMEDDFRAISKNLDDRERWLAEADRNGWAPAFLESCNSAC